MPIPGSRRWDEQARVTSGCLGERPLRWLASKHLQETTALPLPTSPGPLPLPHSIFHPATRIIFSRSKAALSLSYLKPVIGTPMTRNKVGRAHKVLHDLASAALPSLISQTLPTLPPSLPSTRFAADKPRRTLACLQHTQCLLPDSLSCPALLPQHGLNLVANSDSSLRHPLGYHHLLESVSLLCISGCVQCCLLNHP